MPRASRTLSQLLLALGLIGCAEYNFAGTETPPAESPKADTDVATDTEPEAQPDPEDETDHGSSGGGLDPEDDDAVGVPDDTDAEPDPEDESANGSSGGGLDPEDDDTIDMPDDTDTEPAFTACVGPHSGQAVDVTLGFPYDVTGFLSQNGLLEGSSNGVGHTMVDVDLSSGTVHSNGSIDVAGNDFVGTYHLHTCSLTGVKTYLGYDYNVDIQRD